MTTATLPGRIGPNAITRTVDALRDRLGETETDSLLHAAGLGAYLWEPPAAMVPEADAAALFRALCLHLGEAGTQAVARDSGRRTADYLLAHRIPRFAQVMLRLLPAQLACRGLFAAIGKNTWTFAGSGHVTLDASRPARVSIEGCPLCGDGRPSHAACEFYTGAFERLFDVLVKGGASAREATCRALGQGACSWVITY